MVAQDCSAWCVVEVELASHPESHFRDQFAALEGAYYGPHLAPGLEATLPDLPRSDIERLLVTEPPTMVCIADGISDSLLQACRDFGFELAVGRPHRSPRGDYAIDWGRLPRLLTDSVSSIEYLLRPSPELWGGRQRAYLPREFPNLPEFAMRCDQTIYPMRVVSSTRARTVLLPAGTKPIAGRPLLLHPVDPSRGLYELTNGVILE